jgi:hypothetical protein
MEELYVFVSSDDSVEHFGYNSGGQFRAQFPRTYPMKDMGVCVIERFFCTGVRNTHQKGLGMRGFHGKLFVRKKLVPTGSPFLRRTTNIPRDKILSILSIGNHSAARPSESLSF